MRRIVSDVQCQLWAFSEGIIFGAVKNKSKTLPHALGDSPAKH